MKKLTSIITALAVMLSAAAIIPDADISSPLAIEAAAYSKLKAPTGLIYSPASDGKIALSWNTVKGAEGYVIYRYKDGSWVKLATTKKNTVIISGITNSKNYYYKVAALDKINRKYYRGEFCEHIKVQLNYEEKPKSDSAYVSTADQQEILVNYYLNNLSAKTTFGESIGAVSSRAVLANAQTHGGQVMLVYYTLNNGNTVVYGYCITNGRATQITAKPIADSSDKINAEAYFVKEKGSNSYYIFRSNSTVSSNSEYSFSSADVNGLKSLYTITIYGGALYYLNGEMSDYGSCKEFLDSFEKAETGTDELVILK